MACSSCTQKINNETNADAHPVVVPLLHPTPTLSPALLTLSIRLHLSLYLGLPGLSHLLHPPSQCDRLREGLAAVLEAAACMNEGEGGTSRGWKSVILSIMVSDLYLPAVAASKQVVC